MLCLCWDAPAGSSRRPQGTMPGPVTHSSQEDRRLLTGTPGKGPYREKSDVLKKITKELESFREPAQSPMPKEAAVSAAWCTPVSAPRDLAVRLTVCGPRGVTPVSGPRR